MLHLNRLVFAELSMGEISGRMRCLVERGTGCDVQMKVVGPRMRVPGLLMPGFKSLLFSFFSML
jgi:hypothetical protein